MKVVAKSVRPVIYGFVFLVVLVLFNLSYLSNTGLLISGLHKATRVTYKNAHEHEEGLKGSRSLASFRMDPFMTRERASTIAERVKSHKHLWTRRNAAMSTLGTASYLDAANKNEYEKMSLKSNPVMREIYGDLLDDVLTYFKERCPTADVKYREDAALPGFHIFDCNRLFSMPVASVHKDMQWNRLRYKKTEDIDKKYTMSFTLAVELPKGGGGLYTFESAELGLLNWIIPRSIIHGLAKKTKIEYKVGWIVVHNGQTYHMIAPCKQSENSVRMTLQGHGVYDKKKNTWWLYW
jgi:hypothetical protein